MNAWLEQLRDFERCEEASVSVTISDVRGSSPREVGAKMIVTRKDVTGSIGGGQLEYRCAKMAVDMLCDVQVMRRRHRFPLGPNLGQCCGGVVDVLFEHSAALEDGLLEQMVRLHNRRTQFVIATTSSRKWLVTATSCYPPEHNNDDVAALARELLASHGSARSVKHGDNSVLLEPVTNSNFNVAVFGAGHVGSAVVQMLAGLDCNVRWIDSRRNIFPARTAANVLVVESDDPAREVAAMQDNAYYLVLTHSHPLDYEICSRVLERREFAYLGLIGSTAKRRRFERLMRQQGMSQSLLERLTCPIGIDGINGKKPQEIAIAATAELLRCRDAVAERTVSTDNNLHVM